MEPCNGHHRTFSRRRPAPATGGPWTGLFRPLDGQSLRLPAGLPAVRPRACWYVSAGRDFRPLVFFSDAYRQHRLAHLDLPRPQLFVYSCLSPGGEGLFGLVAGATLYRDPRTEITLAALQPLRIDRDQVVCRINPAHVHFVQDPLPEHGYDAALLEVEVRSLTLGTCDRFPVLYLAMENLNCFDALMSRGPFDVDCLCATREGLGMGGCGKSIFSHVYGEGRFLGTPFNPRHVITWSDCTDELFRRAAGRFHPGLRRIAPYIPETPGGHPHHLYRLFRHVPEGA